MMLVVLLVAVVASVSSAADTTKSNDEKGRNKPFAVVGYLPEWRYLQWTPVERQWRWDALCKYLTHLIIFSIEVGPKGTLEAMDRFPDSYQRSLARKAADAHGTKLLICFGGNSRTNGFPQMVAKKKSRKKFLDKLVKLCTKGGLDGVDYNWEYPKNEKEWSGLFTLIRETREAFKESGKDLEITLSYYPDKAQEALLADSGVLDDIDLMHMMSYDQHGQHSTWEFGKAAVDQGKAVLPAGKLTMGLPFYSRDTKTGQWETYEDLVKKDSRGYLKPEIDQIGTKYFNGANLIQKKTKYAIDEGLGGS